MKIACLSNQFTNCSLTYTEHYTSQPFSPLMISRRFVQADSSQVVLRQKQQQPNASSLTIEEDERKTRRISYLRATAHDNLFQMMESSDPSDSSPMSLPPDTPDTEPEAIGDQQQSQQASQQQQSQQPLLAAAQQPQLPQQLKR